MREPQHKSNGSPDLRVGEKTPSHQTLTPTYVLGKNGRKTNPQCENQITMIVIAHRLSTVQHCDRIYKLEEGRIVDQGNFDAMVNKKLFSADLQNNSGKKKF